ncbi:uncharacterized protein LOC142591383 [Dermacentor variabilis]|uniref:uncharacterized protein LOC142591383 n=1 Tax=Dermacentor variabilis TaxID=34621 RepID=UPI003F5B8819
MVVVLPFGTSSNSLVHPSLALSDSVYSFSVFDVAWPRLPFGLSSGRACLLWHTRGDRSGPHHESAHCLPPPWAYADASSVPFSGTLICSLRALRRLGGYLPLARVDGPACAPSSRQHGRGLGSFPTDTTAGAQSGSDSGGSWLIAMFCLFVLLVLVSASILIFSRDVGSAERADDATPASGGDGSPGPSAPSGPSGTHFRKKNTSATVVTVAPSPKTDEQGNIITGQQKSGGATVTAVRSEDQPSATTENPEPSASCAAAG